MADLKISQLPSAGSSLANSDLFAVVKEGVTSKITKSDLMTALGIGGTVYYQTFQEEGVSVPQRAIVDFQSFGLTVSDNGSKTIISLDGDLQQIASLTCAQGAIMVGNAATVWTILSLGSSGKVLRSDGTDLLYSTATYPDTTTANRLLYSSANNTITDLATANNGVLITSGAGVPSISSTLPSAVQGNITALGTIASGVWNGTVVGGTYGGTGVNNGGSTITIGGNVTVSGAFTTTLTVTGNTSVTLPTSGTLAAIGDVYFILSWEFTGQLSPADSTTYYIGSPNVVPNTTDTNFSVNLGIGFTVIGGVVSVGGNTTAGSTENNTLQLRNITQATSSSMGTFLSNGSTTLVRSTTFTGLNISVAAGDSICPQWDAPAYATNPVAARISVRLLCKRA